MSGFKFLKQATCSLTATCGVGSMSAMHPSVFSMLSSKFVIEKH